MEILIYVRWDLPLQLIPSHFLLKGIADRVCLGLIPTSEGSWVTAVKALR